VAALPFALLPKRMWDDWDLPIGSVVLPSAFLTLFGGAALGITGYFSYMSAVLSTSYWVSPPLMLPAFFGYVFFSPRGLFSLYVTISGLIRAVAWYIDEPHGDPLLTGLDHLWRRRRGQRAERRQTHQRHALEGAEEPDRRYDGDWAGLAGVDCVIVSARRKPQWTKGTFVITSDGWFTLGEPFDRPMPNGLRTVYPLTRQTTPDVVRKSVQYELPPLRPGRTATG
jgi:hypothetical protein